MRAFEMREERKFVEQADIGNRRDEDMIFVVSLCVHSAKLHDVGELVDTRNNDIHAAVCDRWLAGWEVATARSQSNTRG